MKKVCFVFAIFAAMFLMLACGSSKDLLDSANTDATDSEADKVDTAADDQTDTTDQNNQDDPNNSEDPNNQDDPNNSEDPNNSDDPNNQNNPDDPNNQNNPDDPNEEPTTDPAEPTTEPTTEPTVDPTTEPTTEPQFDPCNPNQCLNDEHSDGVCTATEAGAEELFTCGCVSGILGNYMWYDGQCRQVVTKHQCELLAEFVEENFGVPEWVTDVVEFVCHCFTDECVIIWEP